MNSKSHLSRDFQSKKGNSVLIKCNKKGVPTYTWSDILLADAVTTKGAFSEGRKQQCLKERGTCKGELPSPSCPA